MVQNKTQTLAITSIPIQQWSTVYEPDQALYIGTIFPDLDLPFFMADTPYPGPKPQPSEKATLLNQINSISFVITDLTLYLDTHETDQQALKMYRDMVAKREQLSKEFTNTYYPLTHNCIPDNDANAHYINWEANPLPWEGACD